MNPIEAEKIVRHWDMLYRVPTGAVDLLAMSMRAPNDQFRQYIEASRLLRASRPR